MTRRAAARKRVGFRPLSDSSDPNEQDRDSSLGIMSPPHTKWTTTCALTALQRSRTMASEVPSGNSGDGSLEVSAVLAVSALVASTVSAGGELRSAPGSGRRVGVGRSGRSFGGPSGKPRTENSTSVGRDRLSLRRQSTGQLSGSADWWAAPSLNAPRSRDLRSCRCRLRIQGDASEQPHLAHTPHHK